MTTGDFADLVKKMRDAQKEYFKTRSSDSLHRSKDYERKVDEVLSSREKRIKAYEKYKKLSDKNSVAYEKRQKEIDKLMEIE